MRVLMLGLLAMMILGCGSGLEGKLPREGVGLRGEIVQISGQIAMLPNGSSLDLGRQNRTMVLIFAADTCRTCSKEAKHFAEEFQRRGGPPKNITFATILIGAYLEDADAWRLRHDVSWDVGIDDGDPLFRQHCIGQTPCVLTISDSGKVIQSRTGEVSLEILEEETGPWQYK